MLRRMAQLPSRKNRSTKLSRISNKLTITGERRLGIPLKRPRRDLLIIRRSSTHNKKKLSRSTNLRLTVLMVKALTSAWEGSKHNSTR